MKCCRDGKIFLVNFFPAPLRQAVQTRFMICTCISFTNFQLINSLKIMINHHLSLSGWWTVIRFFCAEHLLAFDRRYVVVYRYFFHCDECSRNTFKPCLEHNTRFYFFIKCIIISQINLYVHIFTLNADITIIRMSSMTRTHLVSSRAHHQIMDFIYDSGVMAHLSLLVLNWLLQKTWDYLIKDLYHRRCMFTVVFIKLHLILPWRIVFHVLWTHEFIFHQMLITE